MKLPLGRSIIGLFLASIVASIAIISRLPTSECRCHEPPPSEQDQQRQCPFGKLRLLTGTLLSPPPITVQISTRALGHTIENFVQPTHLRSFRIAERPLSRSPPCANA
jgi:hypothetical protein